MSDACTNLDITTTISTYLPVPDAGAVGSISERSGEVFIYKRRGPARFTRRYRGLLSVFLLLNGVKNKRNHFVHPINSREDPLLNFLNLDFYLT